MTEPMTDKSWPICTTCSGKGVVLVLAHWSECDQCGGVGRTRPTERDLVLHAEREALDLARATAAREAAARASGEAWVKKLVETICARVVDSYVPPKGCKLDQYSRHVVREAIAARFSLEAASLPWEGQLAWAEALRDALFAPELAPQLAASARAAAQATRIEAAAEAQRTLVAGQEAAAWERRYKEIQKSAVPGRSTEPPPPPASHPTWPICSRCLGAGSLPRKEAGQNTAELICRECHGTGRVQPPGWCPEMQAELAALDREVATWPACYCQTPSTVVNIGQVQGGRCAECEGVGRRQILPDGRRLRLRDRQAMVAEKYAALVG